MTKLTTIRSGIPAYDLHELIRNMDYGDVLKVTDAQAVINARRCVQQIEHGSSNRYAAADTDHGTFTVRLKTKGHTVHLANWLSEVDVHQFAAMLQVGDGIETCHPGTAHILFAFAQRERDLKLTLLNGVTRIERVPIEAVPA